MAAAPAAAAVWAGCAVVLRAGLSALGCAGMVRSCWWAAARCAALCWTCWPLQRLQCCWWASRRASARRGWPLVHGGGAGCRGTGRQKALVPPLHVLTEWIVRLLLAPARWGRRYIAVPLRKAACARLAALKKRCCPRRPRKKAGKSKKSGKNQLQKKSKILYN